MEAAARPPTGQEFLWDADRYEEAVAHGIFTPDDPIELIDGEIITHVSPQFCAHATVISLAAIALEAGFPDGFDVRAQLPLRLGERSVPEPDIAVVRGAPRDYLRGHPRTAELVIEVADSSLEIDRGRKLRLYARSGLSDYWIVNLVEDCVEVHRQPAGEVYRDVRTYRRGDSIAVGVDAKLVAVSDLLP